MENTPNLHQWIKFPPKRAQFTQNKLKVDQMVQNRSNLLKNATKWRKMCQICVKCAQTTPNLHKMNQSCAKRIKFAQNALNVSQMHSNAPNLHKLQDTFDKAHNLSKIFFKYTKFVQN